MSKFSLFKFTVFTPILTLIFGWPIAENSPGFILYGIFALISSIALGYFLYLFLTNSEELNFLCSKRSKNFINRSLKIGLGLFLLVTITFGQRFDYKSYVLQWDLISRGLDPWGLDFIAESSRNAYGPIHNLFHIFNSILLLLANLNLKMILKN